MADTKISALPSATTPLTGNELVPLVQNGTNVKVAASNIASGATTINFSNVAAPLACTASVSASSGILNGAYYYAVSYVTAVGETPGGGSLVVNPANKQVTVSLPISSDSRVTARKLYRTIANPVEQNVKYLVATVSDNTTATYTDNLADESLGALESYVNTTGGELLLNNSRVGNFDFSMGFGINSWLTGTGYANTAYGANSLPVNTSGDRNVALGVDALYSNLTGARNTAVGVHTLNNNTSGNDSTAVGYGAGFNTNVTLTAVGASALQNNTTGAGNTAVGTSALAYCTTGANNTAFGANASLNIIDGNFNTSFGLEALKVNASGNFNIAFGMQSVFYCTGSWNVGIGMQALFNTGPADQNVAIGGQALYTNQTGQQNVAIGHSAGYYETTSNNLWIDNLPRTNLADGQAKALVVGKFDASTSNQYLKINGAVRPGVYTTSALPSAAVVGAGARAWVTDSTVAFLAANFGAGFAGGGTYSAPVVCTGSGWVIG
jgi:hypothetical protein